MELIFTELINLVSLEQFHYKPMGRSVMNFICLKMNFTDSPWTGGKPHFSQCTVAPLTFTVQEVSTFRSDITIEMHMHDGTEVGHYMGDNMK